MTVRVELVSGGGTEFDQLLVAWSSNRGTIPAVEISVDIVKQA
jgi:hypothetical protein